MTESSLPREQCAQIQVVMNRLTCILSKLDEIKLPLSTSTCEIEIYSDLELANFAAEILKKRSLRQKKFGVSIFGEPSWDILLYLFINGVEGRSISVSSACTVGDTAQTTGMRYIATMCKAGLIERSASEEDRRVHYLTLSEHGLNCMRDYLSDETARMNRRR